VYLCSRRSGERRGEERGTGPPPPPHSEAIKASRACSVGLARQVELIACRRIGQVASSSTGLVHWPLRVFTLVLAGFGCRAALLCIAPASRLT